MYVYVGTLHYNSIWLGHLSYLEYIFQLAVIDGRIDACTNSLRGFAN